MKITSLRLVDFKNFEFLAEEAARRIDAIRQQCPEDFDRLARCLAVVSS